MTRVRKTPVSNRPNDDGWIEHRRDYKRDGIGYTGIEHDRRVGLFTLHVYEPTADDPKVTWTVDFEGNAVVLGEFHPSPWAVDAAKREAMAALGHGHKGSGPALDATVGLTLTSPYRLPASDIDAIAQRVVEMMQADRPAKGCQPMTSPPTTDEESGRGGGKPRAARRESD